jgi:hypothetical protein
VIGVYIPWKKRRMLQSKVIVYPISDKWFALFWIFVDQKGDLDEDLEFG